jgi:uncharacterized protein (TIGR00297 family)
MTDYLPQLLLGAVLAAVIAILSRGLKLLSPSGAIAAGILGFVVFGVGGIPFGIPLIAFFFSSSIASRIGRARKATQQLHYDKTSVRDAGQVLANGGIPGLLVILYALNLSALPPRNAMFLYLAALAAVNADTWATEIGGMWPGRPYLVSNLRRVEAGTSGAVSLAGLVASLAGAFFIVGVGWLVWPGRSPILLWRPDAAEILAIGWAGFVAAFGDSILGASVQAQYRCAACGKMTESRIHCGGPAIRKRGHRRINNDVVNFLTSLMGVLFAGALLSLFANPK